ncbi:MAG: alpha/beta fold hydrolase [Deltaproteobacteria bacterium]|nr:alpha/beta fold hydrolase [Deltaproteobacteria bacterium]MBI3389164.1 alpha/beta fold hydrolase [Deltaproteobacteria bacterium]
MCTVDWLAAAIAVVFAAAVLFNSVAYIQRWWTHVPSCEDDEPLGILDAVAAFVVECLSLAVLVVVSPLGWLVRHQTAAPGNGQAIVLAHGWGLNAGSLWLLRRRLARAGFGPIVIFTYRTRGIEIEPAAERLRDQLASVHATHPGPITIIGHSLGGLVARYCLRRYPVPGVQRLVTIGTPHHGTIAARVGLGTKQLLPDAPLIVKLNAADHVPQQFEVISISSPFDALVIPHRNADYPGACNIEIRAVGHNALLFSRRVVKLIEEQLRASAQPAPRF